jgi:hypothetical protein
MIFYFQFSFRLYECSYEGEAALISNNVYNIRSDLTRND